MKYNNFDSHIKKQLQIFDEKKYLDSLYHYTSLNTLELILSSNRLRFTCINYLNDPIEMEYGLNILGDYSQQSFPQTYRKIQRYKKSLKFDKNLFVFSTSFNYDNLHCWAFYGDKCKGICLNINYNSLSEKINKNNLSYIYPVQYIDKNFNSQNIEIETIIPNFLFRCCQILNLYINNNNNFKKALQLLSSLIKTPFWKFESEIRICIFIETETNIKSSNNLTKRFFDFDFINNECFDRKIENGKLFDGIRLGPIYKTENLENLKFLINDFFTSDCDLKTDISSGAVR